MIKIGDEIVGILDSYGEADELFGHAHLLPLLGGDHGVRCENRQRDQRINATEAGSESEQS